MRIIDVEYEREHTRWSTGFRMFDTQIGGGLTRGIIEIFGPESVGKSTLGYHISTNLLKKGSPVKVYDQEDSITIKRFEDLFKVSYGDYIVRNRNGKILPESKFQVARADTLEEMFEDIADQSLLWRKAEVCDPKLPLVFLLDSLVQTQTEEQFGRGYTKKEQGSLPRALGRSLTKFTAVYNELDVILIVINQEREKIGVMFGDNKVTPGGRAIKFAAIIRLKLQPIKKLPDGSNVLFRTVKNKFSLPHRTLVMPFNFETGFSDLTCAMFTLKTLGLAKETDKTFQVLKDDGEYISIPKLEIETDSKVRKQLKKLARVSYVNNQRLIPLKEFKR